MGDSLITQAEKEIFGLLSSEATLRSKRELIEQFILENLPVIDDPDGVMPAFDTFWKEAQQKEFAKIVEEEGLSAERTEKLIEDYLFAEREPLRDEVLELIAGERPSLLQRKTTGDRILQRILDYVSTFIHGAEWG
jgi:type I restriction enzyme R subunit